MKKTNKLDVWMVSQISAFLGAQIDGATDDLVVWYVEHPRGMSEVYIDFTKKELGFVDWVGDDKTYYSLVGVALMAEFTTDDYFRDSK